MKTIAAMGETEIEVDVVLETLTIRQTKDYSTKALVFPLSLWDYVQDLITAEIRDARERAEGSTE